MKIRILVVGNIKEPYLKSGIEEYLKRLKAYSQIEVIEVLDEPVPDNPNQGEIENIKNKEGKKILKYLKDGDYLISLDLDQKQYKSEEFAGFLQEKFIQGININIIYF